MTQTTESFAFKAEIQQLLHILVHSLYTDKEIFLRELVSNASDALNRLQFEMLTNHDLLDPEAELKITLTVDEEAKTITLTDTGIGMTREELITNLGTIAKSGAAEFLAKVKESKEKAGNIIGQFGVGFYSVFMVAERVEVTSHSYHKEAEAVKWISNGSDTYTLEPAEKSDRGTSIFIQLAAEAHEFAAPYRLEQIVKKHSDFITFPIHLGEKVVNQQTSLWRQPAGEITAEQYKQFYQQLTLDFEEPLTRVHLSTDAPVQVQALLYLPAKREGNVFSLRKDPGLKLYSRNVLIEEYNTALLPNHFRFVQGVVDCEDIPLSVSRENVQRSRIMEKLKNLLTKRVVRALEELDQEKPADYRRFWQEFSPFIKEGIATDFASRDQLVKLLRFPSSTTPPDEWVSLAQYVEKMPEGQEAIYYLVADSLTAAKNSPHMDYFNQHHLQVLFMVETMDGFMLNGLREFAGHKLQNVDGAELNLKDEDTAAKAEAKASLPDDQFAEIVARFKSVLEDKVENVREAEYLSQSPVRLVSPSGAQGQEMDRLRRLLDQHYEVPKKILELNRGHVIIQKVAGLIQTNVPLADILIEQLFDSALLSEGLHPNPAEMLPRIQKLMEAAVKA